MRKGCYVLAVCLLCSTPAAAASAKALKFTTVAVPGARITEALGVNNLGQIVGTWEDPATRLSRGFVLAHGVYTSIDFPGALLTTASGINDVGDIVGTYYLADGTGLITEVHGYRRQANGQFTTITFPGQMVTIVSDINNWGQIVGSYFEVQDDQVTGVHGFLLESGHFTPIDYPITTANPMVTFANGINDMGDIAGGFNDDDIFQSRRGFVLSGGVFTRFDVPGSLMTEPFGTNNAGEFVGIYQDPNDGQFYSFLFSPKRGFTRLTATGSQKRAASLSAMDINDFGQIAGTRFDGSLRGFSAKPPPRGR